MTTQNDKRTGTGAGIGQAQGELPLFAALQTSPSLKVLRLPDVIARVGLKRASIYQRIQMGIFPKPVPLGARAVGWLEHEIIAWLNERVQMRGARQQKCVEGQFPILPN